MSDPTTPNAKTPWWKQLLDYAVLTDIGMRRAINQDSCSASIAESKSRWEQLGHLFIVADGMGAHAAGELASKLAIDLIPQNYFKSAELAPAEALHKSITEANAEIFRRGQANIEFRSMGTTCSTLALLPEGAVVAHVGDSRVYQLRGDSLYQLTFDHSLVWEMKAAGELSDESAASGAIPKNVITRSLGPNANVQVDIEGPFPVKAGDRFLVCSDGLSGQITDEEIAVIMASLPPQEAGQLMIDLSNLRGGPDNITAVIVHAKESASAVDKEAAISTRKTNRTGRFSPALGIVAAVCLIAGVALFLLGNGPLGIVASILGVVALATGVAQMVMGSRSASGSERYGNGPYRHYKATASKSLFDHMSGTMKSLREAAKERGWTVEWASLDDQFDIASKAMEAGKKKQAIATLGRVIIDLMGQIRRQRSDEASDSAVDL